MSIASMTGYARADGSDGAVSFVWEARSVNGRALETRLRVPSGYERLEHPARAMVAEALRRGSVSVSLQIAERRTQQAVRINRELVRDLLAVIDELRAHGDIAPPSADGLLRVRGVIEEDAARALSEEEVAALDAKMLGTLRQALRGLVDARAAEGARLAVMLEGHLATIAALRDKAASRAAAQGELIRARFTAQLADILERVPPLTPERMAQEIAILVGKADVREELDRLQAHIAAAHELMKAAGPGNPIGRKFDFLCQEFNREANTLCSKSADIELTRIGIELKSAVEQMREQVQNVE
ncbi:YicC/YloC family endoribonuclease [Vineibacter terrae]|nr:YicC/YloC family endoribonuclease [Vineibacter terrae]